MVYFLSIVRMIKKNGIHDPPL